MRRSGFKDSLAVSTVLNTAEKGLWASWESAQVFKHTVLRGTARENPLGQFLAKRLPSTYGVCSGEVVDYKDSHSTALDLIIYDQACSAPLAEDPYLMPAESVLAAIEVKTKLSKEELKKCFIAANSIRKLRPFKRKFVGAREGGAAVAENEYRCMYTVFAYSSDLSEDNWLQKEANRIRSVAKEMNFDAGLIDRVVVLDRGLISLSSNAGKLALGAGPSILHEWFLHLMNYLTREVQYREPMDWQAYSSRRGRGWKPI